MKSERLLGIIFILLERKKVTATELVTIFSVTKRTIYRDIDSLNSLGFPVFTKSGKDGGIYLMDTYKIDKNYFSTGELQIIVSGLKGIKSILREKEYIPLMSKIQVLISPKKYEKLINQLDEVIIHDASLFKDEKESSVFWSIKDAIKEQRVCCCKYIIGETSTLYERIEPYQLIMNENQWALRAYDSKQKNTINLYLCNIEEFQFFDKGFDATLDCMEIGLESEWTIERLPLVEVTLIVENACKKLLTDYYKIEKMIQKDEHSFFAKILMEPDDYGYSMLIGLGKQVECVSPDFVREELIQRLKSIMLKYQ